MAVRKRSQVRTAGANKAAQEKPRKKRAGDDRAGLELAQINRKLKDHEKRIRELEGDTRGQQGPL